ncbi:MAG: ACT domain-containing protein [Lachnospiraceae bacterium]|nr:ACT domain-containing protein [Lachnospiraceae bacterium]
MDNEDNIDNGEYYIVRKKAVPQVLVDVVRAKQLIESGKAESVQEAISRTGISRSSFYKYQNDIFPFHESARGTTFTLMFQMEDEPGLLSDALRIIAQYRANILTIHQSIPVSGVATLSLSIQVQKTTGNMSEMLKELENHSGVHNVKVVGQE